MAGTQSDARLVKRVRANGRRVYEWEAKLGIVREAMTPGVSLAKVALRYGLNANLLRKWVVKHHAATLAANGASAPAMLPVMITTSSKDVAPRRAELSRGERTLIEVELARGVVRFDDGIDRAVLRDLIEALSPR